MKTLGVFNSNLLVELLMCVIFYQYAVCRGDSSGSQCAPRSFVARLYGINSTGTFAFGDGSRFTGGKPYPSTNFVTSLLLSFCLRVCDESVDR